MDLQLNTKRVLITGSSSGIGAAIAKALAAEGAAVAIHGRDQERVNRVVGEITQAGGRSTGVVGELTNDHDAEHVAETAARTLGGIDILVNSAGGSSDKKLWLDTAPQDWTAMYEANVLSIIRLVRRIAPEMKRAGWGRIVNISSGAGSMPAPTGPDYSASKAAVNNLTVSLSKELGKDGITVNAVSPGPILTPHLESVFRDMARNKGWADQGRAPWPEVESAVIQNEFRMAVKRVGRAEEIASAVAFLCSPLSGFITGANLRIDGGTVPTV